MTIGLIGLVQGGQDYSSPSSFADRQGDRQRQIATLQQRGLKTDTDTQEARFADEETLYQRLRNNTHGMELDLQHFAPSTPKSFLIFDALKFTQSVKILNLEGALLDDMSFMALSVALSHNSSIHSLILKGVPCSSNSLHCLALSLKKQHFLQELILLPTSSSQLVIQDVVNFYQVLSSNHVLKKVVWPWSKVLLENLSILAGAGNRVAALHVGIKSWEDFCSQIVSSTDSSAQPQRLSLLKEQALQSLQQADSLGHPVASYVLGEISEKEKKTALALQWFQRSFDLKYPPAQVWMGHYHRGVWKKEHRAPDYSHAFLCYQAASLNGQEEGTYHLGRLHEKGHLNEGINLQKSQECYQKAAAKGYPEAFTALIRLYGTLESSLYDQVKARYYQDLSQRFPPNSQAYWHLQELSKTLKL